MEKLLHDYKGRFKPALYSTRDERLVLRLTLKEKDKITDDINQAKEILIQIEEDKKDTIIISA